MTGATRLLDRLPANLRARRIAGRIRPPAYVRRHAPAIPVGLKLEMTYACNLRCGFCYTDSPRHTLARTPELADDDVLAIVDDAIELGILEAVVTGGEPFLRRELTLEAMRRLDRAGVAVTLNTNGWFVDRSLARSMAEVRSLQVNVSVDGATPGLHDRARGVPGSWRRAVEAIDQLIGHGVAVHSVHVVTPANAHAVEEYLDAMWTMGVGFVRVSPVVAVGAAARDRDWKIGLGELDTALAAHRRKRGHGMAVSIERGSLQSLAVRDQVAPAALLVRPDGQVRIDSLHPFTFGNAREDGLATCWQRIAQGWRDPSIEDWASSLQTTSDIADRSVVPYLDDDPEVGTRGAGARRSATQRSTSADQALPRAPRIQEITDDPAAALASARGTVRGLALSRRLSHGPIRVAGDASDAYVRNIATGAYLRLNSTGAAVLGAIEAAATADHAVADLAVRHPGIDRERLEDDVLALVRQLHEAGFLVGADAPYPTGPAGRIPSPDLPGEQAAAARA